MGIFESTLTLLIKREGLRVQCFSLLFAFLSTTMTFEKTHLVLLFVVNMLFLYLTSAVNLHNLTIEEYVDYVNPPAVHKFQKNGVTILCVNFKDQISMRNEEKYWQSQQSQLSSKKGLQNSTLNISYRGLQKCPEGTVAVPEVKHDQVRHAGSVSRFLKGMKGSRWSTKHRDLPDEATKEQIAAVESIWATPTIVQVSAVFNIWQPYISRTNGLSSSAQIWIGTNPEINQRFEAIEVGWHVEPGRYNGDLRPYFFILWTTDGYEKNYCYNMDCEGFVSTSDTQVPGLPIDRTSQEGNQREQSYHLQKEAVAGIGPAWVLYLNGEDIGFFPASLFRSLGRAAQVVDFGAEVSFTTRQSLVTTTEMGSGGYPEDGHSKVAYIRKQEMRNASNNLILRAPLENVVASNKHCYDIVLYMDYDEPEWGKHIYYGGAGSKNNYCF